MQYTIEDYESEYKDLDDFVKYDKSIDFEHDRQDVDEIDYYQKRIIDALCEREMLKGYTEQEFDIGYQVIYVSREIDLYTSRINDIQCKALSKPYKFSKACNHFAFSRKIA